MNLLFVCHGNICRSPMAEFTMKHLVEQACLSHLFTIDSAATSTEELGNPIYPQALRELALHGITHAHHTARQLSPDDYHRFDLILGMDTANMRNMHRLLGSDPDGKLHRLLDFTFHPGDVDDPWYTRDFSKAWSDIHEGCQALLQHLTTL
ncbi:MAG: low molecular weight phosphotyrosine protein phosphatase [Bacteroidales bacterium]|nr:low molecular weight phosphotyrosine protein phosphatase [Bacteroidales bacterium]